jgi:hypothetical protein
MEPQVSVHVHLTVVTLSIIANLLTKSDADKLVLLLTRERPGYVITQTQMLVASRGTYPVSRMFFAAGLDC